MSRLAAIRTLLEEHFEKDMTVGDVHTPSAGCAECKTPGRCRRRGTCRLQKARRKYPRGTPGGKGGQWMPAGGTKRELARQRYRELQAQVDAANGEPTTRKEEVQRGIAVRHLNRQALTVTPEMQRLATQRLEAEPTISENEAFNWGLEDEGPQIKAPFNGVGEHITEVLENSGDLTPEIDAVVNTFPNEKLPLQTVRLATLYNGQRYVGADNVKYYIDHPEQLASVTSQRVKSTHPEVVKYRDKLYINDGHHRLAARHYLGRETEQVRLLDLDAALRVSRERNLPVTAALRRVIRAHAVQKAVRHYPAGTPGGKGGEFMPGNGAGGGATPITETRRQRARRRVAELQARVDHANSLEEQQRAVGGTRQDLETRAESLPDGDMTSSGLDVTTRVLARKLFGRSGDKMLEAYAERIYGALPPHSQVSLAYHVHRGETLTVIHRAHLGDGNGGFVKMEREFARKSDGTLYVKHEIFQVDRRTGQGLAKPLLKAALQSYDEMGVERIELMANIDVGGYAWARMGFLPNARDWGNHFSARLLKRAKTLHERGLLTAPQRHAVEQTLDRYDEATLYDVAGLRDGATNIGKLMLLGETWFGSMQIKPKTLARKRFEQYLSGVSKARRKYPAGTPGGKGGEWMPNNGGAGTPKRPTRLKKWPESLDWSALGYDATGKAVYQEREKEPIATMHRALQSIPREQQHFIAQHRVRVEAQHELENGETSGRYRTPQNLAGRMYGINNPAADMPGEVHLATHLHGNPMTPEKLHSTATHETGHVLDHLLGHKEWHEKHPEDGDFLRGVRFVSHSKAFRTAMRDDTARLKPSEALQHIYYLSSPNELFAETYSYLQGSSMPGRTDRPTFARRFPRSIRAVETILGRHFSEIHKAVRHYPAGTPGGKGGQFMPGRTLAAGTAERVRAGLRIRRTQRLARAKVAAADAAKDPTRSQRAKERVRRLQEEIDRLQVQEQEPVPVPRRGQAHLVDHGAIQEPVRSNVFVDGNYIEGPLSKAMLTAWQKIPVEHRAAFSAAEGTLGVYKDNVPRMNRVRVHGAYYSVDQHIGIVEEPTYRFFTAMERVTHGSGDEAMQAHYDFVVLHEFGHALDFLVNDRRGLVVSAATNDASVLHAIREDRRAAQDSPIYSPIHEQYSQFLSRVYSVDAATRRREIVADLYAAHNGASHLRAGQFRGETMRAMYPRTWKVLTALFDEHLRP